MQAGFINPGVIADDIGAKAKEVKDFIDKTQKSIELSGDLAFDLTKLEGANQADLQAVAKIAEEIEINAKDSEALYHHAEEPLNPSGTKVPLTAHQQELFEKYDKPLKEANDRLSSLINKAGILTPNEGYIQRFVKGRDNPLDKLLNPTKAGEARINTGGLLTQSDSSFKSRTIKALVDEEGNRIIGSIKNTKFEIPTGKRQGDIIKSKRVTAFQNKVASDFGRFSIKSKGKLMESEIKPLQEKINSIQARIDTLNKIKAKNPTGFTRIATLKTQVANLINYIDSNVGAFSQADFKPLLKQLRAKETELSNREGTDQLEKITNVQSQLDGLQGALRDLVNKLSDVEAKYNPEDLDNRVFVAKNGKRYTIADATTKEIEEHTNLEYHKNALASRIVQYLKLNKIYRAIQFLDDWKNRPEFSDIAKKIGEGTAPADWRATSMPQFRGYVFDPRTAEVLDDFYSKARIDSGVTDNLLIGINRLFTNLIFYNPIAHPLNVATTWLVNRAPDFLNPKEYNAGIRAFKKAYTAITTKNDDYIYALQHGAPLLGSSVNARNVAATLFDKLSSSIDENPDISTPMAKAMGFLNPLDMKEKLGKIWHAAAWIPNDILTLQATYETMEKTGMSFEDAIHEVGRFIPNYRTPSRILGSRGLSVAIKTPYTPLFAAPYHYGIISSLVNIAHDIAIPEGANKESFNKESLKKRGDALAKAAMLALLAGVVYPFLSKLAKKVTGSATSYVSGSGNLKPVTDAIKVIQGQEDLSQYAQNQFFSLSPLWKGAAELLFNTDFFTRNQIYGSPTAIGISSLFTSMVSPLDTASKLSAEDIALSFLNVHTPKNVPGKASLDTQLYDEKPVLLKQVKADLLAGNTAKANAEMQDFNQRLITNYQNTLLQEQKPPLTHAQALDVLKQYGIKTPGAKAMANADALYQNNQLTTKQSLLDTVVTYAKAIGTSPSVAFERIFTGQRIVRVENAGVLSRDGAIIVQRLSLSASSEEKTSQMAADGDASSKGLQLDHVIPLEAGGSNDKSNLNLITTQQDGGDQQKLEDFLGKAVKSGLVSQKNVREYVIRFKASQMPGETLPAPMMDEYKNKYGGQPISLKEIMDLVNSGKAK